ncbi:hypothetical protein [Phytohabitans houttuyneae]|uniref:hypothetical protein n=1 Tax=Phytohabitans houttuyneae TaxID=1076126 RepID=UPI0015674630|nr:hypothetical protein [Phytohabitans houttuyneae]
MLLVVGYASYQHDESVMAYVENPALTRTKVQEQSEPPGPIEPWRYAVGGLREVGGRFDGHRAGHHRS